MVDVDDFLCRQLGFDWGHPTLNSYFGSVPPDFAMDDVDCVGQEQHVQECSYTEYDNCYSDQGAGVICHYDTDKEGTINLHIYT